MLLKENLKKLKFLLAKHLRRFSLVRTTYAYTLVLYKGVSKKLYDRMKTSRNILACTEPQMMAIIQSANYRNAVQADDGYLKKKEKPFKSYLLESFQNEQNVNTKIRLFFACLLYFRPFELPSKDVLFCLNHLSIDQLSPAYACVFKTSCFYKELNEADRHISFLREALLWLDDNLNNSSPLDVQNKLNIFARSYAGSVPISHSVNMKDIYAIEKKLLKLYAKSLHPNIDDAVFPKKHQQEKIKIGLIRYDYRGELSFFLPLLKHMDPQKYEVHLITFGDAGLTEVKDAYQTLTYHLVDEKDLVNTLAYLRNLQLDILINTATLSGRFDNPISIVLLYRAAPLQLTSCADVTTTGIKSIDYFIVGKNYITPSLQQEVVEQLLPLPGIGFYMPVPPEISPSCALPGKCSDILFVSHAHLFKLTPDLLTAWLEILQRASNAKLLLMPFNSSYLKVAFEKQFNMLLHSLCKTMSIDKKRIIVMQAYGRENTMAHLSTGDVYLDSFPYCGATSMTEALSLGLPVITMNGKNYRGKLSSGLLEELDMPHMIANNKAEYINIALDFANSEALRSKTRDEILKNMTSASFFNALQIANQMDSAFSSLCGPTEKTT